jgi:ABC-type Fe2+-enterobactin transport system substrate-binding protein
MMENAFNERGVMVTRNGLSAAGQLFALRDIRGVEVLTVQKNRIVPTAISLLGLLAAIAGGVWASNVALVAGVMLVVVGYLAWTTQDVTHRLMVDTADGQREALSSVDLDFVERVAEVVRTARAAASAS